jgi:predicted phosphodiesterase
VHGTPSDDNTYLLEELVDGRLAPAQRQVIASRLGAHRPLVMLCGHSHNPALRLVEGTLVLNPGSVGCPVFVDRPFARTLEHRSPHARYAVLTLHGKRWGAEMFALEYDWESAADRARENGQEDWATAMLTGTLT